MTSLPDTLILSAQLPAPPYYNTLDPTSPPTPSVLHRHSPHRDSSADPDTADSSREITETSIPEATMRYTPGSSRSNSAPSTPPATVLEPEDCDVFKLAPTVAMTLLARSIEMLVSFTGDIPPTPPLSHPPSPALSAVDESSLQEGTAIEPASISSGFAFECSGGGEELDGVKVKRKSNQTKSDQEEEGIFIAAGVEEYIQHGAITRKFWSKSVPDIPIEDYIFRIHRFCPMSTAVYVAASIYLHRLAVVDRTMPITRFNVHRLVLAAIRVASKNFEDYQHSHKRFAKVGGLSENELSRLEVSFCFLVNFELNIDSATMERQVFFLRRIAATQVAVGKPALQPRLPKQTSTRSNTFPMDV